MEERKCKANGCHNAIPNDKRFDTWFCSDKCRNREAKRRYRLRKETANA